MLDTGVFDSRITGNIVTECSDTSSIPECCSIPEYSIPGLWLIVVRFESVGILS